MAKTIPLIRAAALAPFLLWMRGRGLSWQARLRDVGLPETLLFERERPIPLLAGMQFLVNASETEGPDIGCRVVSDTSFAQLATLGRVVIGSRTPREAFGNMLRYYPQHSSHEQVVVLSEDGAETMRHRFLVDLDDTALHLAHQYVAALILVVTSGTGHADDRPPFVRLTPHPTDGLAHLHKYLGKALSPATDGILSMTLESEMLDRTYPRRSPRRSEFLIDPIRGDGSLTYSLRVILPGILDHGPVHIAEIAALAGTSPRSFQRQLAAENTSFSQEIDRLRHEKALDRLKHSHDNVGAIAADLGYSDQSSLTRAMRRWTNKSPRQLR
jgi:AraC-like DNA-binding protein